MDTLSTRELTQLAMGNAVVAGAIANALIVSGLINRDHLAEAASSMLQGAMTLPDAGPLTEAVVQSFVDGLIRQFDAPSMRQSLAQLQ